MWSFGPHNSSHFIKNQSRELLFREALIVFVGAGETKEEKLTDAYCQSCKQANKNVDCSKCNRQVEVIEDVKGKLGNHPSSCDRMAALQNAMPRVMPLYEQARARR